MDHHGSQYRYYHYRSAHRSGYRSYCAAVCDHRCRCDHVLEERKGASYQQYHCRTWYPLYRYGYDGNCDGTASGVRGIHQPDDTVQQSAYWYSGRCSIYGGDPVVFGICRYPAGVGINRDDPAVKRGIRAFWPEYRYLYHGGPCIHRN